MSGINVYQGKAAGLDRANVDTDQIIPKQFLKRIEKTGFGEFLFYDWRYISDGVLNPDFELNRPGNQGATILIANENFGCGSSREHAPWALLDYGFKVIIAPSFADIFYQNCLKNGILPVVLADEETGRLLELSRNNPVDLTVSLRDQVVEGPEGFRAKFDIHPYWKTMLMNGLDEIGLTLQLEDKISAYETARG
ncbi:3-isopropylmalate dehydratase small subunit [Bacillus sp. T33-2]|uniref:3-isopropylmalate dehydratase small subunit n=1 Tax=Bacillus sp. T33-2 TaxID=2054168 RepID=UPI000C77C875|nr:3-isopropylmalate dehydratase small subunit [Bacillus sp. T33-2]PLR93685.1 3-isopropylmalate dehydratase small subunit [Bacillus sp. T33-2]